jgi:hypothetical protein
VPQYCYGAPPRCGQVGEPDRFVSQIPGSAARFGPCRRRLRTAATTPELDAPTQSIAPCTATRQSLNERPLVHVMSGRAVRRRHGCLAAVIVTAWRRPA